MNKEVLREALVEVKDIVFDEKGWQIAAIFFLIVASIAAQGIRHVLGLTFFGCYVWRFKEYMAPYLILCGCSLFCYLGWLRVTLRKLEL